jgi:hypothetical protein
LATTRRPTRLSVSHLGHILAMLTPRPSPVTQPIRADSIWMPIIRGVVNSRVQTRPKRNCEPACEYVAMPLGSSSAAPVMRPGPSRRAKALTFGVFILISPNATAPRWASERMRSFTGGLQPPAKAAQAGAKLASGVSTGELKRKERPQPLS